MYLHEYQAKQLLAEYGIAVMDHAVVGSLEEFERYIAQHPLQDVVLKIQVHAGGRGKAGGIVRAKGVDDIRAALSRLLGMKIVTAQTGPSGIVANKVLLDTAVSFVKEYYLAVILDRRAASVTVIASREGGVEIEEVAKKTPEKILTERVPANGHLDAQQYETLIQFLGWQACREQGIAIIDASVRAFFALDALLLEINPLVETAEQSLIALDAKMQIDDNALFRQPRLKAMYDPSQLSIQEQQAEEHGLAYVGLEGTIGCIVNGAGLAMATMDLIRYWGGDPANFLDVGGGASKEKVIEGFKILFHDPKVKAILVNIFGGIMDCALIADALIEAIQSFKSNVAVVVRMEGTNVQEAKCRLAKSGVRIYSAESLDHAAKRVVEIVHGNISY